MNDPTMIAEWMNKQVWLLGSEPEIEWRQAQEEGFDTTWLEPEFGHLIRQMKEGARTVEWHRAVGELLERVQRAPMVHGYEYVEPSEYLEIVEECACWSVPAFKGEVLPKLHGGLLGRIIGCMLGKPFEGWRRHEIQIWNEECGNWPLVGYCPRPSSSQLEAIRAAGGRTELGWADGWTRERLASAVEDDDINYTIAGFDIVRKYGPSFRPVDVAEYWCANLPLFMMCTAERVAYRNFTLSVLPPDSATFRNPYREWIGAQIRADAFGYLNPGQPLRAAEWAWRDASISHIKNGIYGEMWVAAMLAIAYVESSFETIIDTALSYVPSSSRFTADIRAVLEGYRTGRSYEEMVQMVHDKWDETSAHGWCHTISNAQLVAIALLYGSNDFTRTISTAVMPGFDTDCNGATAGSVWGVVNGVDAIPSSWSAPLNDRGLSHLLNYREFRISELAELMAELASSIR